MVKGELLTQLEAGYGRVEEEEKSSKKAKQDEVTQKCDADIMSMFGARALSGITDIRLTTGSDESSPNDVVNTEIAIYESKVKNMNKQGIPIKSFNVFDFWVANTIELPGLSRMAFKYLVTAPTSVECERLFSDAGNVNVPNRSRLTPEHLDLLTSLKHNMQNPKLKSYVTLKMSGYQDDDNLHCMLDDSEWDVDQTEYQHAMSMSLYCM